MCSGKCSRSGNVRSLAEENRFCAGNETGWEDGVGLDIVCMRAGVIVGRVAWCGKCGLERLAGVALLLSLLLDVFCWAGQDGGIEFTAVEGDGLCELLFDTLL